MKEKIKDGMEKMLLVDNIYSIEIIDYKNKLEKRNRQVTLIK